MIQWRNSRGRRTSGPVSPHALFSIALSIGLSALLAAMGCASAPPSHGSAPIEAQAEIGASTPQELTASAAAPRSSWDADDALVASIQEGPYDPLESLNRGFFAFNRGIDYVLLDPVTTAYTYIVPVEGRRMVRRVFRNLDSARTLVNDVLQLEFRDALVTTARFAINSTVGFAGLFDPAEKFGLPRHESDFGETLARVGVGAGPYLVLPLFGPTTFRDGIGTAVDGFLQPQFWLLGPGSRVLFDSGDGLSLREEHVDDLKHLRDSAVDYYAALRSAYLLDREGEIRERVDHHRSEPSPASTASSSAPAEPAPDPAELPQAAPPPKGATDSDVEAVPLAPSPVAAQALDAASAP